MSADNPPSLDDLNSVRATQTIRSLEPYYKVKRDPNQTTFHCKRCSKAWAYPTPKLANMNPLQLFNHAFSHKPR